MRHAKKNRKLWSILKKKSTKYKPILSEPKYQIYRRLQKSHIIKIFKELKETDLKNERKI